MLGYETRGDTLGGGGTLAGPLDVGAAFARLLIFSAYRTTRLSPLFMATCQSGALDERSGKTHPCRSPDNAARSTASRAPVASPSASAQRPTTRFKLPVTKAS